MPLSVRSIGRLVRQHRERARLSQSGMRPHVSFTTLMRLLEVVGVTLQVINRSDFENETAPTISPSDDIAVLRDDLRCAEEYGVDLSMLRAGLQKTPLQRLEDNDAALEFFASVTVIPAR